MKQSLLLVIGLFVTTITFAQSIPFNVVKSDVFKDKMSGYTYLVHAQEDGTGGSIIVRAFEGSVVPLPKGYLFEQYDANMKRLNEYMYEGRGHVLGMIVKDQKVHVIEVDYSKDKKGFVFTAYSAGTNDFAFTPHELFVLEGRKVNLYDYSQFDGSMKPALEMVTNADNSAFAIVVDIKGKERRNEIHLFNSNLERKFVHPFTGCCRSYNYKNLNVSPDGNAVYMLAKVFTEETKRKEEGAEYQYELHKITAEGTKTQIFSTGEYFIPAMHSVSVNSKIACIGFYSDKNDFRTKGVCYFEADPATLEIKAQRFSPFTEQFLTDKYGKVKDKELKNILLKNVAVTPTGDIVFDAQEEYRVVTVNSVGGNMMQSQKTYNLHFDDIINVKLSLQGDIIYARNLNKRQSTKGNWAHLSYTSALNENNSYFFINTDDRVKTLSGGRVEFEQAALKDWSHFNIVRVKETGEFDFQEIAGEADEDKLLYMAGVGISTNKAVYFLGKNGQKRQLMKVAVN